MREQDSNKTPKSGYENSGEFYDYFANNSDIPFYTEHAKREGSPVLDLAAGTGRVSIALARAGSTVVAIEQSPAMIRVFEKKLKQESPDVQNRITIIQGNMTNVSLEQKFSLVIIPNSFGHAYATEEQLCLLKSVHTHLKDDGLFILDLFQGGVQPERASFGERPVKIDEEHTVSRSGTMRSDYAKQMLYLDLTFTVREIETGNIVEEIHEESTVALIFNREADLLVRMSDFAVEQEFGEFDERPFTPNCGRRIMMLRKRV